MRAYRSIKRFLCTPLGRYLPVGTHICRWENITKIVVNDAPDSEDLYNILVNGVEYDAPKDVVWFWSVEPKPPATKNRDFIYIGSLPEDKCGNINVGNGAQGSQGIQGGMGPQGWQGVEGQGVQGYQGAQGILGYQGVLGSQGAQGVRGFQGVVGLQGSQGDVGPQGVQGQGTQGYQGTVGIGMQGFQGRIGPQGTQGIAGVGLQGPQGLQGTEGQGSQGYQGVQGIRGFQGNQGVRGFHGHQGAQGPQGVRGFQGLRGFQGFLGFQGAQGVRGIQGYRGFQGWQGPQFIAQVTKTFYVDKKRTDVYTPTGSIDRPFLTIQAAINKVISNGDNSQTVPYTIRIATGVYAENLLLESTALKSLIFIGEGDRLQTQINPSSGYALQSTANNQNLYDLHMENIQFIKPTIMVGSTNGTFFGYNFFFENCYWPSTALATFRNMVYPSVWGFASKFSGGITISNVTQFSINSIGGFKSSGFTIETDESANKPNSFSGGTKVIVSDGTVSTVTWSLLNIVTLTGTALQIRNNRYGSTGETIPVNASIIAYDSVLLGNFVNNGSLTLYNSQVSGTITGTAPTLYQWASEIRNDSTVAGVNVKNALETLWARGAQGPQGRRGFQGLRGFQGYRGFQGLRGFQGYRGFQGLRGLQGYRGPQGLRGYQGYKGWQGWQGNQGPVSSGFFGTEFQQASDDTTSNTTGTGWTTKLTMTTGSLPSGTYRIEFYCETLSSDANTAVIGRVMAGVTEVAHFNEMPKAATNEMPNGGFVCVALSGVNNIYIDFASGVGGTSVSIRRARLSIWRIF